MGDAGIPATEHQEEAGFQDECGGPMPVLSQLKAREVLDSRGSPTVEVEAIPGRGPGAGDRARRGEHRPARGDASCATDDPPAFGGKGVGRAVANVAAEIAPALAGMDLDDQAGLDARLIALDGTPDKGRLGANALLGASLAAAHAAAAAAGARSCTSTCTGSGASGSAPDRRRRRADPADADGQHDLRRPARRSAARLPGLPDRPRRRPQLLPGPGDGRRRLPLPRATCPGDSGDEADLVGDEGGYGPRLRANEQAVDRILEAAWPAACSRATTSAIALDVAATHFFDPETGRYASGHRRGRRSTPRG